MRIEIAGDLGGMEFLAVGQGHAANRIGCHQYFDHLSFGADVDAEIFGGARQSAGESAHAAAHVTPNALFAVGFAHDVVKQHIRGARHRRRRESANNGIGGNRGLELLRFEPTVEDGPRRPGENFHGFRHARTKLLEGPRQVQ
jgi:hypothetical protein